MRTTWGSTPCTAPVYEREIFPSGLLGGSLDYTHIFGQFFPYVVHDAYGEKVDPGEPGQLRAGRGQQQPAAAAGRHHPQRPGEPGRDAGVASFFFHPTYPLSELEQIVAGIKALGYTFVRPDQFARLTGSAPRPAGKQGWLTGGAFGPAGVSPPAGPSHVRRKMRVGTGGGWGDDAVRGKSGHHGGPGSAAGRRPVPAVGRPSGAAGSSRAAGNNVTFRLGADLSVRLPGGPCYAQQVDKEHPVAAGAGAPVAAADPRAVGQGRPRVRFPWPWSVYRWLPGTPLSQQGHGP